MTDDASLRAKARAVVHDGKLPSRPPDRTWGGRGRNAPCVVCELPVKRSEVQLEIQFDRHLPDGSGRRAAPGLDKYHIHPRCFAAWELERRAAPRS